MNITLQVEAASLNSARVAIASRVESVRLPVHQSMAAMFYAVVLSNFGPTGFDRPWEWAPLSESYAKRVGRTFATLYVTGALRSTIAATADENAGLVSMGKTGQVPYSLAHHYGNPAGNLPARRVFPLQLDGTVTDTTKMLVLQEAITKVREML